MPEKIFGIANRFSIGQNCKKQELTKLKQWLSYPGAQTEVERWLLEHWSNSAEIDSNAQIEIIFKQIQEYTNVQTLNSNWSFKGIIKIYQKVAALLFIPIVSLGLLYWFANYEPTVELFTEFIIPKGQKSQIILSDSTRVWINSDSKIRYSTSFNRKQRDVYLDGEAYFEVSKDEHKPFIVHVSGLEVKVKGTKFNVKAYPDEDGVETTLFEGKVSVLIPSSNASQSIENEINPGQAFVYLKSEQKLVATSFKSEQLAGWRKNQLIFENDKFSNLVKKIERWYNVEVVYDESKLQDRRLTVELYQDERLDRLMEIIGLTLSVNYKYQDGKIILSPKKSNMIKK